jgi:hypothetical protein
MNLDLDGAVLKLDAHRHLRLRDVQGTCIHVHWGELWITQEGDSKDRIVKAGESFEVSNLGMTLLSALSAAGVSVMKECRELGVAPAAGFAPAGRRAPDSVVPLEVTARDSNVTANASRADSLRPERAYPDVAELEWHIEHAKDLRAAYIAEAVSRGWKALRRALSGVRKIA